MIVKLQLEFEEHAALQRYAEALGVSDEDIAYAALNRLMFTLKTIPDEVDKDVIETRNRRHRQLPIWSDTADPEHHYSGKGVDYPTSNPWFK